MSPGTEVTHTNVAQSSQVEQVLALARALYERGAIPEALAIAREVFVSLLDRDELADLLPKWIRSLRPAADDPPPGAETAVVKAIDWLAPALDAAGGIRALTSLCAATPAHGAALAERFLRERHPHEPGSRRPWVEFPVVFRSPGFGWEIASPVLAAARRQGLVIPESFTLHIAERLSSRVRQQLSPADIQLVNAYASNLRQQGQVEPAIRLAVTSAVTSNEPVPMTQVIEIVRPDLQIIQAAELFEHRGYPTEAAHVLVDTIGGYPRAAAEWQQLWERVEQSFGARPAQRRRSRGQRSRPPAPPQSSPESTPEKSFFFLLKGDQAYKDQVVRSQPVDLHFLYDVPSLEALARLEGKSLTTIADAARKGRPIEIGVFVKPIGLTFRDNDEEYKIATIEDDELKKKVRFELLAGNQLLADAGFFAVLTYNGAEVFQAFIRIHIVETVDRTPSAVTQLALSRATFDLNEALPRDVTAFITTDDGLCRVSVRIGTALPKKPKVLELPKLENAIHSARTTLGEVAESPGFRTLVPGRWGPGSGQEAEFLGALCSMMTAGSRLHKFLKESPATSDLVEAIEALDVGAKISIFTDSAFVPWEILFPRYFLSETREVEPTKEPADFQPGLLWGSRFEFETVLVFSNPSQHLQNPLPPARRQPGTLNIRIGVGSTVEAPPEPGSPVVDASLSAIARHRAYCDQNPSVAHWLDGSDALRKAFADPDYEVSMLYLMCHGKSEGPDQELDFGTFKPLPAWLNPDRTYPGWPVVFINSCSIGAVSPHVFDTFLRRFREKHAFGLIASSFPLPTRFATLFGWEFLDAYRSGARIGRVLLDLRQRLLKDNNPLGFFYALQCPLDIQCPEKPGNP